jgi:Na+-transporting NADH:ubiquinone oxidoreductase subunit NqrC
MENQQYLMIIVVVVVVVVVEVVVVAFVAMRDEAPMDERIELVRRKHEIAQKHDVFSIASNKMLLRQREKKKKKKKKKVYHKFIDSRFSDGSRTGCAEQHSTTTTIHTGRHCRRRRAQANSGVIDHASVGRQKSLFSRQ